MTVMTENDPMWPKVSLLKSLRDKTRDADLMDQDEY
jgi:hypothetical protein